MSIYHSKNQYHYTYEIFVEHDVSNESRHRYIGVRSCNVLPEDDNKYIGSSKHLKKFLKEYPESAVIKTILAHFMNRKDAGDHEIELHNEFDVARNPEFFNLSKHTSTGFCVAGTTRSEESRRKQSESLKGRTSPNKGKSPSEETRRKRSESRKGKPSPKKGKPGKPHSEETKQKMSEKAKGIPKSEETRLKMSHSMKGRTSPNKGKSRSEESRRKQSESRKNRPKFVCRVSDRKEYRACDITQYGLEKLGLS